MSSNRPVRSEVESRREYDDSESMMNDDSSELSVGEITETTISNETSPAQLAASLSLKQNDISTIFASMVAKMASMIEEQENEHYERLVGNDSADIETIKEAQRHRKEMSEKVINTVKAMAKKQISIGKEFEKIIADLQESNRQKYIEQVEMKRQLQQMKEKMQKMKIEQQRQHQQQQQHSLRNCHNSSNVNSVRSRISEMSSSIRTSPVPVSPRSPSLSSSNHRMSHLPPRHNHQQHQQQLRNSNSLHDKMIHDNSERSDGFSIQEISFSSFIVDIEEVSKHIDDISMDKADESVASNVRLIL